MDYLEGKVDYILTDRINYNYGDWVYKKYGLEEKLSDEFFDWAGGKTASTCRQLGIEYR